MSFIRFTSSQRYGSHVPLRQLAFRVVVSRAFLIEDETPEVLCEVTVPWNGKLPSPQERLNTYKQLEAALSMSTPASVDTNDIGADANATAGGGTQAVPTALAAVRESGALPTGAQVVAQLNSPASQLFTRPPTEDYIDSGEEDFPVDPPMGGSLLAPIVLRQHRRDHQPNTNMYFMWASGKVIGAPEVPPAQQQQQQEEQKQVNPAGGGGAEGQATRGGESTATSYGVSDLAWLGEERVLCTITAERDENFFTAKPSLNVPHTILVDAVYIYSFTIRAVDGASLTKEDGAGARTEPASDNDDNELPLPHRHRHHHGHRRGERSNRGGDTTDAAAATTPTPTTADAFLRAAAATASATLAAAEQATESIRTVSEQATAGYEALQLLESSSGRHDGGGGGLGAPSSASLARAQRLLRDAAMTVPDDRTGVNTCAASDVVHSTTHSRGEENGTAGEGLDATLRRPTGQNRRASLAPNLHVSSSSGVAGRQRGCRYYVYGVVERCLGLPYDTLFLKCALVQEPQSGAGEGTARDVPTFFLEQEALAKAAAGSSPSPSRSQHPQRSFFSTQLAYAGAVTMEDYLVEVDHVFNTPFEYVYVDSALPTAPLRLMVTALSEGFAADGSQTPVGYCCVSLPVIVPGTHKVQCPMWAPHQTGKEYVKAMLAGGGPSLVDMRESGPALRNRTGIAVKQGLLADSAGTLVLTVNVVQQEGAAQ